MAKIYVAGPMFNQAELPFNKILADHLETLGHTVFLPQHSGFRMRKLLKTMTPAEISRLTFTTDFDNIRANDVFLYVLDGYDPDEGATVALGLAYANGKSCYGFKTDIRTATAGCNNAMIDGSIRHIFGSFKELDTFSFYFFFVFSCQKVLNMW